MAVDRAGPVNSNIGNVELLQTTLRDQLEILANANPSLEDRNTCVRSTHALLALTSEVDSNLRRFGSDVIPSDKLPNPLRPYVAMHHEGRNLYYGLPVVEIGKEIPSDGPTASSAEVIDGSEIRLGSVTLEALFPGSTIAKAKIVVGLSGYRVPGLHFCATPGRIRPEINIKGDPDKMSDASSFLVEHGKNQLLLARTMLELVLVGSQFPSPKAPFRHSMFG